MLKENLFSYASQKIWHASEEKLFLLFGECVADSVQIITIKKSKDSISVCDQRFNHLPSAHKSSKTCCNVET